MDPFPRIDIFVRVSSCSLFNEFPRGPRSLPTKLNCNRERERGSIRICVFEIESKDISYAQAATEANENLSALLPDRAVIGSVWKIFRRCYLFTAYGFILHEDAPRLTLCLNIFNKNKLSIKVTSSRFGFRSGENRKSEVSCILIYLYQTHFNEISYYILPKNFKRLIYFFFH